MATIEIPVFRQWVPFEPVEVEKGGAENPSMGRIKGIASSEQVDADGEIIIQKGIDWSYFLNHGFLSLEHPLGVLNTVGESVSASVVELGGVPATQITADIHLDDPVGKAVWEKAKMLKKSSSKRKLGFSIEGEALERDSDDPTKIVRSRVVSVAISAAPKNPLSWFEPIAASMLASLRKNNELLEGVGSTKQAIEAKGHGGSVAPLVPQSIDGVASSVSYDKKLLDGMSERDLLATRVLKQMPGLSWSQGLTIVDQLTRKLR